MLLDAYDSQPSDDAPIPHEAAVKKVIALGSQKSQEGLAIIRKNLCAFVVLILSIVGSETIDSERNLNGGPIAETK